jgi:hypothetical protein
MFITVNTNLVDKMDVLSWRAVKLICMPRLLLVCLDSKGTVQAVNFHLAPPRTFHFSGILCYWRMAPIHFDSSQPTVDMWLEVMDSNCGIK